MPSTMSFLNPNNPAVIALMKRNPNGVMAQMLRNNPQFRNSLGDAGIVGGNNAGSNPFQGSQSTSMGGGDKSFGPMGGNNAPVSFAAGGMMTPQGGAIRPGAMMQEEPALGAANGPPISEAQIDQEANNFVQQHPQEAQKIQAVIAIAMQSGELTQQELNTAVQLAKTALANPASYPQIRQFAIQNGLGTEADIPEQMDKGLLFTLLVAGKSMASAGPQGNAMQGQGPASTMETPSGVPEYKDGGMTGDRPHLAKVHPREYVIPEDALIYHGKKHFDKLVEQARTPPDAAN